MNTVNVVVPCYNEEAILYRFYEESEKVFHKINGYEFSYIFVNDGSKDRTHLILRELSETHQNVKYMTFSRNFGKEAAMYAGLCNTDADYVIIMDADLQHPPALIPEMIHEIEKGYDCCAGMRRNRQKDAPIKRAFSSLFYKINNCFSSIHLEQNATDFRIMTRQMIDNIIRLAEVQRFSKGIFSWVGFKTSWISFDNIQRPAGNTKWSFKKLFRYAITGVTSFSVVPLGAVSVIGLAISLISFLLILFTLFRKFVWGIEVSGYASLMIALLFLGGVIELSLGILGEYIANIYMESKDRPIYIVKDSNIEHYK